LLTQVQIDSATDNKMEIVGLHMCMIDRGVMIVMEVKMKIMIIVFKVNKVIDEIFSLHSFYLKNSIDFNNKQIKF